MNIEIKRSAEGCAVVSYPVFSPEKESKQEARSARRMTEFYTSLCAAVAEYAKSADFPPGGRYSCECRARAEENGDVTVTAALRLRVRGRSVGYKMLCHRWRGGLLVCEKTICNSK